MNSTSRGPQAWPSCSLCTMAKAMLVASTARNRPHRPATEVSGAGAMLNPPSRMATTNRTVVAIPKA